MIGLDTNVLVRYVMQDDARQSALATALIEQLTPENPGFVPLIAVVEFSWVLRSAYRISWDDVSRAIEALLRTRELVVERAELIWKALRRVHDGADFADALIERAAAEAGCGKIVTFDRRAAETCGMELVG